ncbi:MAG: LD-carboxypeptidase [Lachnospiraceae bacterium]|nr:LD-carboxypeptidase [Lachnospiraceae bacterium]
MRYPKFLEDGERIGLIAPSFGGSIEPYKTRLESAVSKFESLGYKVIEGPNTRLGIGIGKSNTPKACADEINDFFTNDKSDIILSCGGGETMCEDMPLVDFEEIKKAKPKWFAGYSDNTNLTFLLNTLCDTAAVYGPCVGDFGMQPWHESIDDLYKLLRGEKLSFANYDLWEEDCPDDYPATGIYNVTQKYCQKVLMPDNTTSGEIEGRLIGGCMDVLSMLCGTKFDKVKEFIEKYKDDGIIWFLESCELNPFSIRRVLWQFEQAGWFKYTKGFIFGRPLEYKTEIMGLNCHEAVSGILDKYKVPIVLDINIGHISPSIPIISGSYAKIAFSDNKFEINYDLR